MNLAEHAQQLIQEGYSPDALAHPIMQGKLYTRLSTPLAPDADLTGLTEFYQTLAWWMANTPTIEEVDKALDARLQLVAANFSKHPESGNKVDLVDAADALMAWRKAPDWLKEDMAGSLIHTRPTVWGLTILCDFLGDD